MLETTARSKSEMLDELVESHRKNLEAVFNEKRQLQATNEVRTLHSIAAMVPMNNMYLEAAGS